MKSVFHSAAALVRDRSADHGAVNPDEKLWWSMRARRAIRDGNDVKLDQACRAYSALRDLIPNDHRTENLDRHIATLARANASDKIAEVRRNKSLPEFAVRQKIGSIQRWAARWAPAGKRVSLQGMRGADGNMLAGMDECHAEVARHWGNVFSHKSVCKQQVDAFLHKRI